MVKVIAALFAAGLCWQTASANTSGFPTTGTHSVDTAVQGSRTESEKVGASTASTSRRARIGGTSTPLSLGVGIHAGRQTGKKYLELRYSGQRWKHWSAYLGAVIPNRAGSIISPRVGAELYETWFGDRFITGLGLTLSSPDQIVGTSLRYNIRFGWRFKNGLSMELVHESNCAAVCNRSGLRWARIPGAEREGVANHGYNYLTLRVPLRR